MEFKSALEKRNLQTTNLPVAQQKKIADLLNLVEQVEEAEADADPDEQEEIKEAKEQIDEIDQEIVSFIETFDLEKYEKKKQSAAAIREKRLSKYKEEKSEEVVEAEPQPEPKPQPQPEPQPKPEPQPQPQPQPKPEPQPQPQPEPQPPVLENEKPIGQEIKELEAEGVDENLLLALNMEGKGYSEKEIYLETGYYIQNDLWTRDEDWKRRRQMPVYNEFEKVSEVKKKPKNYSMWFIGLGAFILTIGAVNLFKDRK
jgi:hypothetical protein